VVETHATAVPPSGKTNASLMKDTPKAPVTVLIVDDEEALGKFVARVLSDAGYSTTVAPDGPEAI